MAWFKARFRARDIYEIGGAALERRGIRLLLADLDNTLVPYSVSLPDDRLREWKKELRAHGVELFILSNSRKKGAGQGMSRVERFARELDVPYIRRAGKPGTASFYKAMERMGAAGEQTAIVGDQIFTDILGASRAGVTPLLVLPIRLAGNPGRYLRYAVEIPFRLLSGRREAL